MSISAWIVAAGVLVGAPICEVRGLQTPSQPTPALAASFADAELFDRPGSYVYVPDGDQAPIIRQAIDKGVRQMFPLARAIARGRLMNTNKLPHTLQVIVARDSVGTRADADKPMNLPRSGVPVRWENGIGDVCGAARSVVIADTLLQLRAADRGSSVARYVLQDSGEQLQKIVHITSPHLSGPIDYAIRFRRSLPADP